MLRQKPEIVGPDGANTTFFGSDISADGDSFPNFFGTSAAAPHAAAVAALLLDADPTLVPDEVYAALENTALDMGDPGFDDESGFGFIQADLAVASISGGASPLTSTITASPTTITAEGISMSTITVELKDANNDNLTSGGDEVTLVTDLGSLGLVTDNGDGTYTATLTSTVTGTATITGTINGLSITDTATVTVTPGVADATTSLITAATSSIAADGVSTSIITVQLKDANINNLTSGGDAVTLATDLGSLGLVTDNGDGTYTATLTSATTAGTATITGTANAAAITDNATVSFTQAATETIEIIKATFSSKKGTMKVVATSSLGGPPDTNLTATLFYDTTELPVDGKAMKYNSKKDKWSVTFDPGDGVTITKPEKVKVCSTTTNTCVERTDIGER